MLINILLGVCSLASRKKLPLTASLLSWRSTWFTANETVYWQTG